MMNNTKNRLIISSLEISLRILILLSEATVWPLSESTICAIDFMATFGKEFGLSSTNLHGDNAFKFSQLPARKELVKQTIKKLVRLDFVAADFTKGYRYEITEQGTNAIGRVNDSYSREYREAVRNLFYKYGVKDESAIENALRQKTKKGE